MSINRIRRQWAKYEPGRYAAAVALLLPRVPAELRELSLADLGAGGHLRAAFNDYVRITGSVRAFSLVAAIATLPERQREPLQDNLPYGPDVEWKPRHVRAAAQKAGLPEDLCDFLLEDAEVWRRIMREIIDRPTRVETVLREAVVSTMGSEPCAACAGMQDVAPVLRYKLAGPPWGGAITVDHWICAGCAPHTDVLTRAPRPVAPDEP